MTDLQALSDAATPNSRGAFVLAAMLRLQYLRGRLSKVTVGDVEDVLARMDFETRAATPVVPEGLDMERAAINAAARLEGEVSQLRWQLAACTEAYDHLAASPSPDTDRANVMDEERRMPCAVKVEGSIGACLVVGTDYRVAEIRGHIEPSGVEGELGHETTVIRFDPVPSPDTDAGLDVSHAFAACAVCGAAVGDPEAREACRG